MNKKKIILRIFPVCTILVLFTVKGCKIADLRTDSIDAKSAKKEQKAIDLLDKVIENQGLAALAQAKTYSLNATDDWKGILALMNPLPKNNELMVLRYRPMSFDGQFNYLEGRDKTIYGTQSFKSYEIKENGEVTFKNKEKITFSIAAIQYFLELPLRLKEAPILKYAGTRDFEGKTYDLVFATWDKLEPHKEHDQYLLYISQNTGYLSFVNYTIRGMYIPMPKYIYGSLRLANMQTSTSGITFPGTLYVQLNNLKKEKRSAHTIFIDNLKLNSFPLENLYPDKNLEYKGDSKN
ncbi:hypothetical protein [uncultured Croceitalea sp.]|uniref:hypothetical protein n=1 Tax=uncultured Croceitalea sp. TaxID=1798908 RepID=UPI003306093B